MVQPMPLRQRADSSEGWTAANRAGNKQQRKAKRANDAKKIQKRELSQDLWGRQRGGGKGHWKKKLPGRGGHYGNGIRNQIHDQIQAITALDGANADLAETADPALETDGPPTPLLVPESSSQQRSSSVASPQIGRTIRWGSATAGVEDWATPRRSAAVSRLNYGGAAAAAAASPPPPPSPASSAVFGGTLPSLTPKTKTGHKRTGSAAAAPPLSRDSIVHAIFEALFGRRQVRRGPRESYGGAWDESDDDGDDPAADAPDAVVDESWIKSSMDVSLFSSKALQFAVSSVGGADLLSRYVDADAVARLVDALRRDDPRVPSPRLAILRAVHEHCRHLRLPMLRAAAAAAQERLTAARAAAARARDLEVEAGAAGAGGTWAARDQGQTLLELLLYVLEHMPEPQEVGAGSGGGGALLAQFEQEAAAAEAAAELRTAAQAAAGDGGARCREPAKGYAAVAAAALAAQEERDGEWPAGVRGDTLRESLRLLLCAVKCYGTVPTSGDAGGGGGGADEDELNLLQRSATALVTLHPPAAEPLISRLCAAWPAGDGHREAGCLAVAGAALAAATAALRPLPPQSRAARALMRRALASVTSPGTRVVQAAVALLLAPPALHGLLAPRRENLAAATAALAANRAHWSPLVRDLSEQSFDALLDFY